jgi:uncharacterized protein YggE
MAENNSAILAIGIVLVVLITAGLTYFIAKSGEAAVPPVLNITNGSGADHDSPTITVRGEATKTVQPDLMTIGIAVQTSGTDASDAQSKNAEETAKLTAALLAAGVKESEIQTTSYYTNPEYNDTCYRDCYYYDYPDDYRYSQEAGTTTAAAAYSYADEEAVSASLDIAPSPSYPYKCDRNCSITGYKAYHSLTITSNNTKAGGSIVQAALNSTGSAKIDYVYFSLKEETRLAAESELQVMAASSARAKADNIAKGLGAKVGKLVSITPDYYYPYYAEYAYSGGASAYDSKLPAEFYPTGSTMSSSMTVVYELIE